MSAVKRLTFENFYNELEVQEQIPLRKLLAKLPTWFADKGVEFHLEFDGVEQLTDEVFHLLETAVPDEARARVTRVSCVGCRHLRDDGVAHLARAFPRLLLLSLDGCEQLTERSLHYLGKHCRDLQSVSMLGTQLTHCGSRQLNFAVQFDPAFQFIDGAVSTVANLPVKLAVICDPAVPVSIASMALSAISSASSSRPSSKSAAKVTQQQQPSFQVLSGIFGNLDMNVFEMRADLVYSSLFMSNTAGFVLVIDAERTENPQLEIMRMIDAVRGAVFEAPLLLVATVSSEKGVENVASLKSDLENMLKDQVENMKEHLEKEHLNSCYDKDFPHQWRYVQSIQCADITHFPISLIAVPVGGFKQDWVFEAVLREVKIDSNVQAQMQYWAEHDYMYAIDALDRCTKADFSELRSLSVPPTIVLTTMKCVMLIFDIPFTEDDAWPTVKKLVSETRFLLRFKDMQYISESLTGRHSELLASLIALVPEWETFGEQAKKLFNITNCMWLYVYAVIKYLLLVKEHEQELNPSSFAATESSRAEKEGNRLAHHVTQLARTAANSLQLWETRRLTEANWRLADRLAGFLASQQQQQQQQWRRLFPLKVLMTELGLPPEDTRRTVGLLKKLHQMGKLLFFPNVSGQPVVLDPAWFMACLARLDAIADYRNGDSCWVLGRSVPALSGEELRNELIAAEATEDEAEALRRILLRFGLLGRTDTVRESTQAGRVARLLHAAAASSSRYFLWSRLEPRVSLRLSASEEKLSMRHHKSLYMPDLQSEAFPAGDLCLLFSVKFRVGFPANLLARFAAACMQNPTASGVVQLWRTGMHVQRGVCDILCTYGLHSTLASSSIDFECRVNEMIPGANSDVLKEYMWSCFSDLLTILESVAAEYPYLHHKLRVYCRGECFHSGLKNTFSVPEVGRTLTSHKSCTKCRVKQMTDSDWRFMWYRIAPFPRHDWMDRYQNSFSCEHCFLWKNTVTKLWRHFCRVYPTFATKAFEVVAGLPASLRGNLLVAARRPKFDDERSDDQRTVTLETLLRSRQPMRHASFDKLEVGLLRRPGCELAVFLALSDASGADDDVIIGVTLCDGRLKFTLKTGAVHEWEFARQLEDNSLRADDPITTVVFSIESCVYNEHYDCYFNQLEVLVNGEVLLRAPITDHLHAFVRARYPLPEDDQQPADLGGRNLLILGCPEFAHVSTLHFHPGMLLLFRTGVGQTWLPGVVTSIRDGLLEVAQPEDLQAGRQFPVDSGDIRPLGFYPEEINAVIDKKQLKGFDQWFDYLADHPTYSPVPFGNFQYLDEQYTPLPIRNKQSRHCTSSANSPSSLVAALTTKWNPSRNPVYFILLPADLKSEDLFIPPRMKVQSEKNQSLHFLCRGLQWSSNTSDMHLLDKPGVSLTEEEYQFVVRNYDTSLIQVISILLRYTSLLARADLGFLQGVDGDLGVNQITQGIWPVLRFYRDQLLLKRLLQLDSYKDSSLTKAGQLTRIRSGRAEARPESASGSGLQIAQLLHSHSRDLCDSHAAAKNFLQQSDLGSHVDCVRNIRARNQILPETFPNAALLSATNITNLELSRCRMRDTSWVSQLPECLINLQLQENFITKLDPSLSRLKRLKFLNISNNPISYLPNFICEMANLSVLDASGTQLNRLPEDIGRLSSLTNLMLKETLIQRLPAGFGRLKKLRQLSLTGVPLPKLSRGGVATGGSDVIGDDSGAGIGGGGSNRGGRNRRRAAGGAGGGGAVAGGVAGGGGAPIMSYKVWSEYRNHGFAVQKALKGIGEELFARHDVNNDKILQAQELQKFLAELFITVPRLCIEESGDLSEDAFPTELLGCRSLETLVLSNQAIRRVPPEISALKQLRTLILDHNIYLESVQGNFPQLTVLSMQGCENLKTPPQEILAQGMLATIAYLRRLASGSVACYRTKLMFVGLGGAGKTSLMRALMSPDFKAPQLRMEAITDGIDISTWTINRSGQSVTFSVWDFAGQTLYYNTHQFFLTSRAVYLLVWNMRLGFEHAGLDFWMNSISCHAPGVPIFVVGTHCDKVAKFDMPVQELRDKYPSIVGFFTVSSASGEGVEQLLKQILETTLSQPYIGEHVPEAWLNFEKAIISNRSTTSLLKWSEVVSLGKKNGIYGDEVPQAVQFLHDMGSLQHFDSDLLFDIVIINPQWLVDVMACVVTVHNHVIKEGRFKHEDIHSIWKDYPAQLHEWLLTLTETFDLTFPLTDSGVSVVPCLLPQKKPQFEWEDVSALGEVQEAKMKYVFDYLPAGLFNRAQVRLCQFSDDLVIWQRGSLLSKGDHRALMVKKGERTVIVKVQGSSPENMLMLIHEVFEGLIAEAFGGVSYVYEVPCIDCVRQKIQEPAMFSSQVLRRAIEMRALFLQCHSMFHCVPIPTLQAVMPPESPADFELHFERSVNDLSAARLDLVHDVTLIFCSANRTGGGIIDRIQASLESAGLSVQRLSDEVGAEDRSLSESMSLLQQSGCCLCLISNEFVLSEPCSQHLSLATEHLNKPFVLGLVGNGKEWQQTALGARLSGLVYINFQREAQFDDKLAEVVSAVREKSGAVKRERVSSRADVFISYCWANSHEAVKAGHGKATSRSLGFGDPRKIKKHLEEVGGLSCWIDVERLGEKGLFEDLCQGLKACKVVVACLSDEYVASKNCQMEFRFAHLTLNRPMIICVVGTGVLWESTEIGMMSLGHPKVNFQAGTDSCFETLLNSVTECLEKYYPSRRADSKDSLRKRRSSSIAGAGGAMFQELIELAQRKVYRQYAGFLDPAEQFPCLIVPDIYADSTSRAGTPDDGTMPFAEDAPDVDLPLPEDEGPSSFLYRFRLLCEHEGGWHAAPGAGLPIRLGRDAALQLLAGLAPLLLRLMLVIRHSRRSGLDTAADPLAGGRLLDHLRSGAERAGPEVDLRQLHAALREYLRRRDPSIASGLRRCHLPSGKILWLCPEHQSQPRTVVLAETAAAAAAPEAVHVDDDQEEELLAQVIAVVGSGAATSVAAESAAEEAAEAAAETAAALKRRLTVTLGRIDEAAESPEPANSAASSAAAAAAVAAAATRRHVGDASEGLGGVKKRPFSAPAGPSQRSRACSLL